MFSVYSVHFRTVHFHLDYSDSNGYLASLICRFEECLVTVAYQKYSTDSSDRNNVGVRFRARLELVTGSHLAHIGK